MGDLVSFQLGPRCGLRRGIPATDWYARGCALEATDVDGALAAYRRAIAGRPDLADAHNNLGRLLHDRGDAAEAEACYRVALCLDPSVALYWFNLGVAVEDLGRHAEAIAAYERAIAAEAALDPRSGGGGRACADAHFNLARLLELGGRRADDELLLRRAVRHLARYRDLTRVAR